MGSDTVVLFHKNKASEYYENALGPEQKRTDLVSPKVPHRLSLSHAKFLKEVVGNTEKSFETLAKCVEDLDPEVGQKSLQLVRYKQLTSKDEAHLYKLLMYTAKASDSSSNNVIFSPETWRDSLCNCAHCQLITTTKSSVNKFLGILRTFVESKNK